MTFNNELLRNNYTFEQAESLQIKYQNLIKKSGLNEDIINFKSVNTIAGVDISYYREENIEYGIACAVNWNKENALIEEYSLKKDIIKFPYKSGFLGFRECKLLAKAISKLSKKPDLIMCDGHGKIHPRRFGEAVHLGIALNIPTIGVAKNPFVGYSKHNEIDRFKGNKTPVWVIKPENEMKELSNELLGYAVCLKTYAKPVFISVGYKMHIDIAVAVCLATTKHHQQPEPLYLADYFSREETNKSK
ncbi:MAG: endonuclease V [Promethearchaeota archaeon]|jgi:deoxyribonuclease V